MIFNRDFQVPHLSPLKTGFTVALLTTVLAACEPATETVARASVTDKSTLLPVSQASGRQQAQLLDLQVTRDMMDQVVEQEAASDDNDAMVLPQPFLDLRQPDNPSRIKLKGEVYYDDTQENYLQAIDGGKLDIEIKFNG